MSEPARCAEAGPCLIGIPHHHSGRTFPTLCALQNAANQHAHAVGGPVNFVGAVVGHGQNVVLHGPHPELSPGQPGPATHTCSNCTAATKGVRVPDQPTAAPAELYAADNGYPVVAVASYELASALTGDPIMVSTLEGAPVLLRLLTIDEVLAQQSAAVDTLPPGIRPPLMSRARAAELVAPLRRSSGT